MFLFNHKYVPPGQLNGTAAEWKAHGESVALALGCFDLVHVGCVRFLQDAAAHGRLIVGVYEDADVTAIRGPGRPILSLEHRMVMTAAFACVSAVTPVTVAGITDAILAAAPDFVVVGSDQEDLCKKIGVDTKISTSCRVVAMGGQWQTCSEWVVKKVQGMN
jgi:D-beta-D-heptose 7-phosphate kinase/D-beta-D-heptose 1-phosphate adenosyltransferase